MMMPGPGAAPQAPPMGGPAGAAAGAAPGAPPGGVGGLLGMMPGMPPTGGAPSDPAETMRMAMDGIQRLDQAIKQNPQMIEVLAAVLKTHPTLRLLFLAASRRPEEKAVAGAAAGNGKIPPILGR